jgi:OmpA-OmpF porin, OOP family
MKMKLVWMAFLFAGVAQAQEMEMQVELMNRVTTENCRKGDLVSARVVSPAGFQGSVAEGKLTECKSGGRSGQSVLGIDFDMLRHNGTAIPINSKIKSSVNSKGQANVDEEGRVVGRAAPQKRSGGTGGLGRVLGGLGGNRGAQIGGAVDVTIDAAERVSSDAPNIRFDPGARFILSASARSGPALASLASSSPSATASAPTTSQPTSTATAAPKSAGSSQAPSSQPVAAASQAPAGQPDLVAVKADFIPGEKVILYDDFSDMGTDDPPPHWKVRGGTAELRVGGNVRQLTMSARNMTLTPNLAEIPKNFTMEMTIAYKGHGAVAGWIFRDKKNAEVMLLRTAVNYGDMSLIIRKGYETLTDQSLPMDWKQPVKQAFWVQNGRMRFYINDKRVMDINQVDLPELASIELHTEGPGGNDPTGFVGVHYYRFAESTPDFSQVIMSSGRYVTHGILFDTDSDKIKPESAAVIKMIARGLETNPALKLCIEGHTDSVGSADHNMDLSKRRAEAVKTVLVGQFNVDASRLTTNGLGATKPVDSNDTPQGRAQNRRVELVKQ